MPNGGLHSSRKVGREKACLKLPIPPPYTPSSVRSSNPHECVYTLNKVSPLARCTAGLQIRGPRLVSEAVNITASHIPRGLTNKQKGCETQVNQNSREMKGLPSFTAPYPLSTSEIIPEYLTEYLNEWAIQKAMRSRF